MIFGNRHLQSFGSAKVTKWKNSVYADFTRQEIVYRGNVVAAVEVPTVRNIEADVLVRGKNRNDLQKKLKDIGKWLYGAGLSKLFAQQDTTHYYKARCVQVSPPEYSGFSARFVATFVCSDRRLYHTYNDQPTETATDALNNFSFDGKHCLNDMGCVFVLDSIDMLAKPMLHKYEIAGASGTLRYDGDTTLYEEKEMSGTLHFVKSADDNSLMSESDIAERLHRIASWLGNAKRSFLILDADISRRYIAEIADKVAFSKKDWENGSAKIKFVLQPYSESIAESAAETQLSLSGNEFKTVDLSEALKNGIGYETPICISITNNGSTPIEKLTIRYDGDKNKKKTFTVGGGQFRVLTGATVEVDSLSLDVRSKDATPIISVIIGDFPVLCVGCGKKIEISTGKSSEISVKISFRARWL